MDWQISLEALLMWLAMLTGTAFSGLLWLWGVRALAKDADNGVKALRKDFDTTIVRLAAQRVEDLTLANNYRHEVIDRLSELQEGQTAGLVTVMTLLNDKQSR